jgi:hypothetical protein
MMHQTPSRQPESGIRLEHLTGTGERIMTHSPEPWTWERSGSFDVISDSTGDSVIVHDVLSNIDVVTPDLNRIVACVNACKGIPTERLVKGETTIHHDLTADYAEPLFMISGNMPQVIQYAMKLLQDKGHTVSDNHE